MPFQEAKNLPPCLVGQGLELFEPRHRHAPESGGFNDVSQHFVLEPGLDVEVAAIGYGRAVNGGECRAADLVFAC